MENLKNAIRRIVADMIGGIPHPRFATVTAYDGATHSAKVLIQPDGIQTGWLPMHAIAVGNGIGLVIPPSIGDQVTVTPKEGDADNYVISGRLFHDDAPPPTSPITGSPIASGEVGIFGPGGSFVHLTGDGLWHWKGNMIIDGNLGVTGDLTMTGTADGASGSIKAKGDVVDKDGAHGSMDILRSDYNGHTHHDAQGGNVGVTNTPTP